MKSVNILSNVGKGNYIVNLLILSGEKVNPRLFGWATVNKRFSMGEEGGRRGVMTKEGTEM